MITRFIITLWLIASVCCAGPMQLLLGQKTPAAAGISVNGAAKASAFNANPTATITPASSECLIVWTSEYGASGSLNGTVTDDLGSAGWTQAVSVANTSAGTIGLMCWYLPNASPSITTVTFNRSTGSSYATLCVHRVSGLSTSTPFTGGELNSSTGTAAAAQSGTVSNGTANSIYFAGVVNGSGNDPCTLTINSTGTTGTWSLYNSTNSQELSSFSNMNISCPNLIVASSSARGHGWAFEGSLRYACAVAVFH